MQQSNDRDEPPCQSAASVRGAGEVLLQKPIPKWRTIALTVTILAGVVFLIATPVTCYLKILERVHRSQSEFSLGQIYAACITYCNANNGRFPDSFATMIRTTGYPPDILLSSDTPDTAYRGSILTLTDADLVGHCSYVYCGNGLTVSSPESEILAYEPLANYHGNGTNVLHVEKSITWLSKAEAEPLIQQVQARMRLNANIQMPPMPATTQAGVKVDPASRP